MKYPLIAFPSMLAPVAVYAAGAMFSDGAKGGFQDTLLEVVWRLNMPSGGIWEVNWGHIFVLFGLVALFVDLIKSTGTGRASLINHVVSVGALILCVVFFLLLPAYATSPFFFLLMMTLLDVVAGFTITAVGARRDFSTSN